ncbi:unnamed protein product [Notodromas monacha]|uniref:NADH dehydrogenase [ubiquinone] 1 alpha subcomplex subunit 10, mitochondrial n=1 Tax=Notodromas monacha TaxID=399045 RepID=A0A7R9BHS3_9CRUS|nr:unnamed protein product [Notodromas monacha]CAG0914907.1 unnamed protein product [Notodromas monacha]
MRLSGAVVAFSARLTKYPLCESSCAFLLPRQSSLRQPSASITSKAVRGEVIKPAPFPYRKKKFGSLQSWYDRTSSRMDENSKVIVVDGPPAAGKTEVAKEIAELLDFLYVPEAHTDLVYINSYGYDMKQLDPQLPPRARSFTMDDFNKNPFDERAAHLQLLMYKMRYLQYIDVLTHVLNTGQGVVLDRSVYSDSVFLNAMTKNGYVSKKFRWAYNELRRTTIRELMRPHLVVYLDVSVDEVLKRLKKRGEENSKALTKQYVSDLENFYKHEYLKGIEEHAHLLVYDWNEAPEAGDVEGMIEDIERLEFAKHEEDEHDPKMKDWWWPVEEELAEKRYKYSSKREELMSYFIMPGAFYDCPEVWLSSEETETFQRIWENAPGHKYFPGYNASMGDTNLLFKYKSDYRLHTYQPARRSWWIPEK